VLLAECACALIIFNACVVAIALLLQIRKQAMDSQESNKPVGDVDSEGLGVEERDPGEISIKDGVSVYTNLAVIFTTNTTADRVEGDGGTQADAGGVGPTSTVAEVTDDTLSPAEKKRKIQREQKQRQRQNMSEEAKQRQREIDAERKRINRADPIKHAAELQARRESRISSPEALARAQETNREAMRERRQDHAFRAAEQDANREAMSERREDQEYRNAELERQRELLTTSPEARDIHRAINSAAQQVRLASPEARYRHSNHLQALTCPV